MSSKYLEITLSCKKNFTQYSSNYELILHLYDRGEGWGQHININAVDWEEDRFVKGA